MWRSWAVQILFDRRPLDAGNGALRSQDGHDLAQSEDSVQAQAVGGQVCGTRGLAVDQDDDVFDEQAGVAQGLHRFDFRAAGSDQVVQDDSSLPRHKVAFDDAAAAVVFDLMARIDERLLRLERHRGADRQGRIGNRGQPVEAQPLQQLGVGGGSARQGRGIGGQQAQVNVDRRRQAADQGELAELDGPNTVQVEDQPLLGGAHELVWLAACLPVENPGVPGAGSRNRNLQRPRCCGRILCRGNGARSGQDETCPRRGDRRLQVAPLGTDAGQQQPGLGRHPSDAGDGFGIGGTHDQAHALAPTRCAFGHHFVEGPPPDQARLELARAGVAGVAQHEDASFRVLQEGHGGVGAKIGVDGYGVGLQPFVGSASIGLGGAADVAPLDVKQDGQALLVGQGDGGAQAFDAFQAAGFVKGAVGLDAADVVGRGLDEPPSPGKPAVGCGPVGRREPFRAWVQAETESAVQAFLAVLNPVENIHGILAILG
ncbi:MAG: hypothetical protein P8186_11090 [Anaerolineae bacterium]